ALVQGQAEVSQSKSGSLLIGHIFDSRGNRMTPSHARKKSLRYRYYVSAALVQGQAERAGSITRVAANEIETLVVRALRDHLNETAPTDDRELINTRLIRVEVHVDHLALELKASTQRPLQPDGRQVQSNANSPPDADDTDRVILRIPWKKTAMKRRREI